MSELSNACRIFPAIEASFIIIMLASLINYLYCAPIVLHDKQLQTVYTTACGIIKITVMERKT